MIIKDVLTQFITNIPFLQVTYNIHLKNKIIKDSSNSHGWNLFHTLLLKGVYGKEKFSMAENSYHPKNVLKLCDKLGVKTFEDLNNWIKATEAANVTKIINILDPEIHINTSVCKELDYKKIEQLIKENMPCLSSFHLEISDRQYTLLNNKQLEYIVKNCPAKYNNYIAEKKDCDDFSIIFKSFLSKNNIGNVSLFYTVVNRYSMDDKYIDPYVLISAITYSKSKNIYNFHLIEPQDDWNKITDIKEPYIDNGKQYKLKIRFMM